MRSFRLMALLAMCLMLLARACPGQDHHYLLARQGGELGEITDEMIKEFNASQDKYEVKGVYKGNYDEAMTAAIAAFRAKQHPNLIQIFEVGTASMMAAKAPSAPCMKSWKPPAPRWTPPSSSAPWPATTLPRTASSSPCPSTPPPPSSTTTRTP